MARFYSNIKLSVRMLLRDWQSGDLRVLLISLIIAVSCVTAVSFFTNRVEQGINDQAAELIAAELVLSSSKPFKALYRQQAQSHQIESAKTLQFRSVVLANDKPQLVEVKAVTLKYPLQGRLRISDSAFGVPRDTDTIPVKGSVWVEARLLSSLELKLGDDISLGKLKFKITQVIRYEPDRGGGMFSMAPRVMMNFADIAASGLIQTGSLATYRLLFSRAQADSDITLFKSWLALNIQAGEKIITTQDGRPELRVALDRAQEFLGLAALVSVLLAGVAIATTATRFSKRHLDSSAIIRCLGAPQSSIIQIFGLEMLWLALIASSIGNFIGWLTQFGLSQILSQLLLANLPNPTLEPIFVGYFTAIVLLLGFALPPLLMLKNVTPLSVLRRDQIVRKSPAWLVYLAVFVCMGILLQWQLDRFTMVLVVILGMLVTIAILACAAFLLILCLNYLRRYISVSWKFGLANIIRHPASSVIQIVAFGIGIMVLLLLSIVRTDLMVDWKNSLPKNAANHFLINVQSDQVSALEEKLKSLSIATPKLYPMIRARLFAINNVKVTTDSFDNQRAKHLVTREFNLSWAENLQIGNKIVAGKWWAKEESQQNLLSLEKKIAKDLNIKLFDTVQFNINGDELSLTVSNIREVNWDSFNINFFTVVPPKLLDSYPTSWVTSFYLDATQKHVISEIVKQFPNVTVIDVEVIMNRVRGIIERVSFAIEFIFIFSLLAGLAVLFAAIQSNQDERRFESAIIRTLGAPRKILLRGLIAEFVTLGAIAGLLAGLSATTIAIILAEKVWNFDYHFDPLVAIIGIISGVFIVGIAGVYGSYSVLTQPPLKTLREV